MNAWLINIITVLLIFAANFAYTVRIDFLAELLYNNAYTLEMNPDTWKAYYNYGHLKYQQQQFPQAESSFNSAWQNSSQSDAEKKRINYALANNEFLWARSLIDTDPENACRLYNLAGNHYEEVYILDSNYMEVYSLKTIEEAEYAELLADGTCKFESSTSPSGTPPPSQTPTPASGTEDNSFEEQYIREKLQEALNKLNNSSRKNDI